MRRRGLRRVGDLMQRRDVVQNPKSSSHRRNRQILAVNAMSVTGVIGRLSWNDCHRLPLSKEMNIPEFGPGV